jgi:hypothetical protein
VPRPPAERADPVRQLCPGPRRQTLARLPAHRHQRLVPAALPDPTLPPASGRGRVRDDGAGQPDRHLGRRRANRARCRHHHHRRPVEARRRRSRRRSGGPPTNGSTIPFTLASTTSGRAPSP